MNRIEESGQMAALHVSVRGRIIPSVRHSQEQRQALCPWAGMSGGFDRDMVRVIDRLGLAYCG